MNVEAFTNALLAAETSADKAETLLESKVSGRLLTAVEVVRSEEIPN